MLHGNRSKSDNFLVLNWVQSFKTQSCCCSVYVIRTATQLCCFVIPVIFFNRELPDLGDDMGAYLMEHVNESLPVHLCTHHGAFLQYNKTFSFNNLGACWSGHQLHFLPPNQQCTTQDYET